LQGEKIYFLHLWTGLEVLSKHHLRIKQTRLFVLFLHNPLHCANYVYANRGGNGDQASGDGFKFRGGGFLQNTFRNGYEFLKVKTGIDFVSNPDLILVEANAMICAILFWNENDLNKYADLDDLDAVSDAIN
jgi:putative chitinase